MTREEAVKELKIIRENYWDEYEDPMPALDMAIKALEQQSEDAISRQAVIDSINEYFHDKYYQRTSIQDCMNCFIEDVLNHLPSATPQQPCEDCISRADAKKYLSAPDANGDRVIYESDLDLLPPVQPKYNASEWCHDCKEYDQDKHCCPRFNRVIRNAVEEIKQPKTGHWILTDDDFVYCSECEDSYYPRPIDASWYYCPHCGAKMIEPQEE